MPPSSEWRFSLINWSRWRWCAPAKPWSCWRFPASPLPLLVEQAVGAAHQLAGLGQRGVSLPARLGQLLHHRADVLALGGERAGGLVEMVEVRLMRAVFSSESRLLKRAMSWLMLPIRSSPLLSNWVSSEAWRRSPGSSRPCPPASGWRACR